jgi:serine phosphatase RsbU (regulator of sigma subunit)
VFTSRGRWPRQLLVFGLLGALFTLIVAGSAIFALSRTVRTGHELGQLSQAQRRHQDADMMHDALRADVSEAEQAGLAAPPRVRERIQRSATSHATSLRKDLSLLDGLQLPSKVDAELDGLRGPREAFVTLALQRVTAELNGNDDQAARRRFRRDFQALVARQATVTQSLADTAATVDENQTEHERNITGVLVIASGVALVGWALLITRLRRAGMRLFEALDREAEQRAVAEQLQRSLLPERLPDVPGLQLAARSRPVNSAMRVGGDWYDVISLPSGEVGLVVGDVVGHDLRAATAMGQLRASLRAFAIYEPSPARVLARVNTVADLLEVTDLTTCLYAIVNPETRMVRWSSAGHLNPLAVRASGQGQVLGGDPGPPIGVSSGAMYVDRTCRLEPQGSLMLYTDGLVERRSASISENLTLLESIHAPRVDADGLVDHVLDVLLADEPMAADDVTLLALQAAPEPAPEQAPQPVSGPAPDSADGLPQGPRQDAVREQPPLRRG